MAQDGQPELLFPLVDEDSESDENDEHMDHEDNDDELAEPPLPFAGAANDPHRLLRWMQRIAEAATNEELLGQLEKQGVLRSEEVKRALRLCRRDVFLPEQYRRPAIAFLDNPVRLEALDFNVSAPHMHATCLEALQLRPGHAFLDIGSGCGLVTAAAAHIVGRAGRAVGVDTKRAAVALARQNVAELAAACPAYAAGAAPALFAKRNGLLPSAAHQGKYDRVHCGAACPPAKLGLLLSLLGPGGGLIVTPVEPSDLRLIARSPSGAVTHQVLSQVRYSSLELPSDLDVMHALLRLERRARRAVPVTASSFAGDVEAIKGVLGSSSDSTVSERGHFLPLGACFPSEGSPGGSRTAPLGIPGGEGGGREEGMVEAAAEKLQPSRSWPQRVASFLSSCRTSLRSTSRRSFDACGSPASGSGCSSGSASPSECSYGGTFGGGPASPLASPPGGRRSSSPFGGAEAGPQSIDLGERDCQLAGLGWALPVHRCVLRARCEQFRAKCDSGMSDSLSATTPVPEHFSKAIVEVFVAYLYTDALDPRLDAQAVVEVLHLAHYFGAPRLAALCELALAAEIRRGDPDDPGTWEAAATLLGLAEEAGLARLRAVAVDFIVHHYRAVAKTSAWAALPRRAADAVTAEAVLVQERTLTLIKTLPALSRLPLDARQVQVRRV